MTDAFINDPGRNRLEGDTLYVNEIFKWYAEDFNNDAVSFFLRYARGDLRAQLESKREEIKVNYLEYDWSLNGK